MAAAQARNGKRPRLKENLAPRIGSRTAKLLLWHIRVTCKRLEGGQSGRAIWHGRQDIAKGQLYLKLEPHCGRPFSGMRLGQSGRPRMHLRLPRTERSGTARLSH